MGIKLLSPAWSYTSYMALALPIQRNAAQVKNRCCCEQDIQRCPDKAEHLPVNPDVLNQLNGTEGHHKHWHQQIRKGERHNEIIGFYFPVGEKCKGGGSGKDGGKRLGGKAQGRKEREREAKK